MRQLFQSVKASNFSDTPNISSRSTCLNWLTILALSVTLLIMNAQFVYAQSDTNFYYVRGGDTLTTIAFRHGVSVQELMNANNLHTDLIHVGVRLTIPTTTPQQSTPQQSTPSQTQMPQRQHIVPQPQTAPTTTNQTVPSTLPVPQATVPQTVTQPAPLASNCSKDVYVAQRGDTLYSIAIRSNSNVSRIKRCNNLHADFVRAGQVLVGVSVPQSKQSSAPCNTLNSKCQPTATALGSNARAATPSNTLN